MFVNIKKIMIEVSSLCNHRCVFCSKKNEEHPGRIIDDALAKRMIVEAYEMGAKEISFHAMGEPLLCKKLDEYIKMSKDIGYDYIYIDTNGALADMEKMKKYIEAGLDSIKFSVGAANKEDYKIVHGRDDFDIVIENIKKLSEYRDKYNKKIKIIVDFVETIYTKNQFDELKEIIGEYVDDLWFSTCSNQGGILDESVLQEIQVTDFPDDEKIVCNEPFDRVVITADGYVSACCMYDQSKTLFYGNVNESALEKQWNNERHKDICQSHLDGINLNEYCRKCNLIKKYQVKV